MYEELKYMKEYLVVFYDKEYKEEEYDYYSNKAKAIKVAKDRVDDRTATAVYLCRYYKKLDGNIEQEQDSIYESDNWEE